MEKLKNSKNYEIGILGGGQLARMMALKSHELGIPTAVFSENSNDPAAQVTQNWVPGQLSSEKQVRKFLNQCRRVTFESEFFEVPFLKRCSQSLNLEFFPRLQTLKTLQYRNSQKQSLVNHSIATSPFTKVFLSDTYTEISLRLSTPKFVIKKNIGGYDGYGTFIITSSKDYQSFLNKIDLKKTPCIAEQFINFRRELAITFARNKKGDVVHFPFVESYQESSRCLWVKGPIFSQELSKFAKKLKLYLNQINYIGVIAFEIFESKKDCFLVNEVAPRVHNSSHYSLNGFSLDQFSLHLIAGLNQSLTQPEALAKGFAMYNILGSGKKSQLLLTKNTPQIHWYGKVENRKGRKMGHINAQDRSPLAALRKAEKARLGLKI